MSFMSERVKNLVGRVGQDVTFVDRTSAYNTSTGENVHTDTETTVKGFVRKYTPRELTGGLVQQIDREVKVATDAISFTPKESDQLKIETKTYTIIAIDSVNAKNDDCLYVIQVRGNAN